MQQRQPRLGDILDDYCPRERRVTNHAVVAMVGEDVKQTRCTTCEADHEYKHAKVPRQRKKSELEAALALGAQATGGRPARVAAEPPEGPPQAPQEADQAAAKAVRDEGAAIEEAAAADEGAEDRGADAVEEGPVHRTLIRATLPRLEGQPPPQRPAPDFTIHQPSRANRFRPRNQNQRGGAQFGAGNRPGGGYGAQGSQGQNSRGPFGARGPHRPNGPHNPQGGAPQGQGPRGPQGAMTSRPARRHDRKRPK